MKEAYMPFWKEAYGHFKSMMGEGLFWIFIISLTFAGKGLVMNIRMETIMTGTWVALLWSLTGLGILLYGVTHFKQNVQREEG